MRNIRRKTIWIIDKYFLPPPAITKNRYKIFWCLNDFELIFFHSSIGEYGDKFKKIRNHSSFKDFLKIHLNVQWKFVPSVNFNKPFLYLSFSIMFFIRGLFTKKPDLIIASCPDPLQAFAGLLLSKIKKVKYVVDFRDYWPELLSRNNYIRKNSIVYKILFKLTKLLANKANGIIAVETTDLEKYLHNRSVFILSKKIYIRQNIYLELKNQLSDLDSRAKIRELIDFINFSKSKGKLALIISGTLNVSFNSINTLSSLLNNFTERISLIILSNDMKAKRLVNQMNRRFSVRLLGMLSKDQYMLVLRNVDALLVFSLENSKCFSSNKVLDAISMGIPVLLGTDINPCIDLPGLIVFDPQDTRSFRNSLKDLIKLKEDSSLNEKMKRYARSLYENQKKSLIDFLNELLESEN